VREDRAERLRDLEGRRLDALQVGLVPGIRNGDPRAIGAAVRLMERRARLFGLDAPTEFSGPNGGPLQVMKQMIHQHLPDDGAGGARAVLGDAEGPATALDDAASRGQHHPRSGVRASAGGPLRLGPDGTPLAVIIFCEP
jgi:hypothetical protein